MFRQTIAAAAVSLAAFAAACAAPASPPRLHVGFDNVAAYGQTRPAIGRFLYNTTTGRFTSDGVAVTASDVPWVGESGWIKSPSAVVYRDHIYVYFAASDSRNWLGVGLAILDRTGHNPHVFDRPVLPRQPEWGYYGGEMPRVVRDKTGWKMWVAADPAMGYATSDDGIHWTYRGDVDVPHTAADAGMRIPAAVVHTDGWWNLFTQDMTADGRWTTGVARSRNPDGPYQQAASTVLAARTGNTTVTVPAGSTHAVVAEPGVFAEGEPVYIGTQPNRVVAVHGNRLELADPADRDYTSETIRTWAWDVYLTDVWMTPNGWQGLGTGFHGSFPYENTLLAKPANPLSLTGQWKIDTVDGMPVRLGPWTSAENPVLAR